MTEAGHDAVLRVEEVTRSYPAGRTTLEVLRGVTFTMGAASALAITGPSGSGKSTLLHLIGGLDRPTSGRIEYDGTSPQDLPEPQLAAFRNRRVGFVFQDHHLLPQYSVLENVLLPTRALGGGGGPESVARARHLLERVGLDRRLTHHPDELSGGERQRTAVARALINRPGMLLCDEPTGSLDRASAKAVAGLLFDLHAAEQNLLIIVTHNLDLARRFDRRLELVDGRCSAV